MAYAVNIDTDYYFLAMVHKSNCGRVTKDALGAFLTIWDAICEGARSEGVLTARVGRCCLKPYYDIVVVSVPT